MSGTALEQDQRFTLARDLAWCADVAGVEAFDLDVAACAAAHCAPRWFDVKRNGLKRSWAGRVWCNPPFSDLGPWVTKAWREMAQPRGPSVVAMLLPASRTEQPWWQHDVEPHRDRGPRRLGNGGPRVELTTRFLPTRTRFGTPDDPAGHFAGSPPFGCVLLVWKRAQTSAEGWR